MMRIVLILLLAALLAVGCSRKDEPAEGPGVTGPAGSGEELPPDPQGFRGVSWGVDPASVPGLEESAAVEDEAGEPGREKVFTRRNEKLSLAGAKLRKVEYRFREGRFTRAVVYLEEGELILKGALFERYGAVGPAVSSGPAGLTPGGPYKEYRWEFAAEAVSFYLDTSGQGSLLLFAAAAVEGANAAAKGPR